ncbi:MAG: DUF1801 domain-containing protein [Planctomycetes bacterium]|nr:DUF1801 domain-containing protein [Planctomycetota bacterium]
MAKDKSRLKVKATSRDIKPRKSVIKSKSSSKSGAKSKPDAKTQRAAGKPASRLIDQRIRSLGDWRGDTLAEVRRIIHDADPEIVEERKWVKPTNPLGVPVWSHAGIVCTGETYKQVVKLTFARGASLPDPRRLFNSSLEGNMRRAIDIREGEEIDGKALKALIRAAIAENLRISVSKSQSKSQSSAKAGAKAKASAQDAKPVKLLSGGNPQIAKGDGDAPVQEYIAAMPGWKRELGKRLDALIVRNAPKVRKAVKWNSPFYGIEGQGWFLSFHVLTHYVKVTFFAGTSLRPIPSGGTPKSKQSRWIDIRETDKLDEAQMATWVKQAAKLPGWVP